MIVAETATVSVNVEQIKQVRWIKLKLAGTHDFYWWVPFISSDLFAIFFLGTGFRFLLLPSSDPAFVDGSVSKSGVSKHLCHVRIAIPSNLATCRLLFQKNRRSFHGDLVSHTIDQGADAETHIKPDISTSQGNEPRDPCQSTVLVTQSETPSDPWSVIWCRWCRNRLWSMNHLNSSCRSDRAPIG